MANEEHLEQIRRGFVHRGPFKGHRIADLSSEQLRGILGKYTKPDRGMKGTRAALLAAVADELERRDRGDAPEPSAPVADPKPFKLFRRVGRTELAFSGTSYQSRNAVLRTLGFRNYGEYLQSELWRKVRDKVFAIKGKACYLCGGRAWQVHHNRYHKNDLTGKRVRFINPICGDCHHEIEFSDGEKVDLRDAAKAFKKRRKDHVRGSGD